MDELKRALALVLDLASQQIDQLDDETMTALTQLLNQAAQRIDQIQQQEMQSNLQEAEVQQAEVAQEMIPQVAQPSQPSGETVPELQAAPHESSNINAFRYDPKTEKLFVKFQGKYPSQNGPVYSYEGVPRFIFDVFKRGAVGPKTSGSNAWHTWKKGVTPSHGAAMNALIKQAGYPYQRIT